MKRLYYFIFVFLLSSFSLSAQTVLLAEDFNDCALPAGWASNVIGSGTPNWAVGIPDNPNSDGTTIDGSCMLWIDDDAVGNNTPGYVLQFISPFFDGTQFPEITLELDVHFRAYEVSVMRIMVFDGTNYHLVREYGAEDGTGAQFSEFETLKTDISFYASENMAIVIEYDDNDIWAWWAGVDNLEVTGQGEGVNVLLEDFGVCGFPDGWQSEVVTGDVDWQFGFIDNPNAVNSMNGTCFAYFDDDGAGQTASFSTVRLYSPIIDGSAYATYTLDLDLVFRKYSELENFGIYISDGIEVKPVQIFLEEFGGPQFNEFEHLTVDLSEYRAQSMQLIFQYDDGDDWGWWVGMDNIKVKGNGSINDVCSNAIELEANSACEILNNTTAIFSGEQPTCSEDNVAGLWYHFVPAQNSIFKFETQADFNDVVTVFAGACDNLTEVACTNRDEFGFTGEMLYTELVSSNDYFIRVSGQDKTFGLPRGNHCLTVEAVAAYPELPVNDVCSAAIPLTLGSTCTTGNNRHASFEGPAPSLNLKSRADIWYTFEATSAASLEILSGADFADVITLYSGNCGSLTEVASEIYGQRLEVENLEIGTTYYIQIAAYFATLEGEVCVAIKESDPDPVDNNDCISSTTLTIGNACYAGENVAADFSGIAPSCEVFPTADVWFDFIAPASGGVQLNTGADFVHTLALYTGSCNNLEELQCWSSPQRCDGFIEMGGLTPGETYYLQLASAANTFGYIEGNFCLQVLDYNATPTFEALTVSVEVNCFDQGQATLIITPSGGLGNYTLLGDVGGEVMTTGDEYLVIVQDENDCEIAVSGVVECGVLPCLLDAELEVANISCHGETDGQAAVLLGNGEGPYTFLWSDGSISDNINNLPAGEYTVAVSDVNACTANLSFTVNEPGILVANTSAVGISAGGATDGSATAQPIGGTPPFNYWWSNNAMTATIEDVTAGIYSVTVTDANGCQSIESVVVSDPSCTISLDADITDASCHGSTDGQVAIQINEAAEPYLILWSNGAVTGSTVSNLSPGAYAVTVTDANNCPATLNFLIQEPSELQLNIEQQTAVSCFGANDGYVEVQGSGGAGGYTYLWSNSTEGNILENASPGSHTVTVTDQNGCTTAQMVTISQPEALEIPQVDINSSPCFGFSGGDASVFVTGGTPGYTYLWNDAQSQTSSWATELLPGNYEVTVTDAAGCTIVEEVMIGSPEEIVVSVDEVINEMDGDASGQIMVSASGGVGPLLFNWLLDGESVGTDEDLAGLPAGVYQLEITDQNGCTLLSEEIVVDNIVSTEELTLTSRVQLMPNPTAGAFLLHIQLPEVREVNISIFDISGKLILRSGSQILREQTWPFNLSHLAAGVYPVRIQVGEEIVVKRVVITH